VGNFLRNEQTILGLSVWLKNIFTPMYGQHDFLGKAISFFMRLVQIIARSFLMLIYVIIALILVAFWLVLPPLVVGAIFYQLL
jgi:fatty acid desaturase